MKAKSTKLLLSSLPTFPTIAELNQSWYTDLETLKTSDKNTYEDIEVLKQKYNNKFGQRADFLLWNLLYISPSSLAVEQTKKRKWQLVLGGLQGEKTIFWNILALLPELIKYADANEEEAIFATFQIVEERIVQNPPFLTGAEYG